MPSFDTAYDSVNRLNWELIYQDNKEAIDAKVQALFENNLHDDQIRVGAFRALLVNNTYPLNCIFKNDEWFIQEGYPTY
jgi:hypothetical protein